MKVVDPEFSEAEKKIIKEIEKETSQMRAEARQTQNESLKATERLVGMGESTKEVGAKTLRQLHEQGEQIRRIENREAKVGDNINEANKQVHKFKGKWGPFGWGHRKKRAAEERQRKEAMQQEQAVEDEIRRQEEEREQRRVTTVTPGRKWMLMNPQQEAKGSHAAKAKIGGESKEDATERKINENLSIVEDQIAELREQSRAMGETIEAQDTGIDRVLRMAEKNRVNAAKTRKEAMSLP